MSVASPPGGRLGVILALVFGIHGALAALTITEIHYEPPAGGPDLQFVEVFNDASTILDLSRFRFTSGFEFTFPEGTLLAGRSYLLVCADLAAVQARYSIQNAIGDLTGNLDPDGETLKLVNASGVEQVEVSYRDRGKWPAAPRGTGHTLALRSPYLDPDDGVNWSASLELGGTPGRPNFPSTDPRFEETVIIPRDASWKYVKGTEEFSSPQSAWRQGGFSDAAWLEGRTGIGYGDGDDVTNLTDMQNGYLSIAARKTFTLSGAQIASVETLVLAVNYDDGFVAYLNGVEVARSFLGNPGDQTPFSVPAGLHEAGAEEEWVIPKSRLAAGTNLLAVQVHNNLIGSTDLSFIPRLISRRELVPGPGVGAAPAVLNEVLGRAAGERWLELCNPGTAEADLSGYHLSDSPGQLDRFTFAAPTRIPAGGFLVLTEAECGLALGTEEVRLLLTLPDRSRVVDAAVFENQGPALAGTSDVRFPDGAGGWVRSRTPTAGAANGYEVETELVINEVLYNPLESRPAASQPVEQRPGEFIELYNRGTRTIALGGMAITRGVDYTFAQDAVLGPGEYLVVAEDPAYIQSAYGIANVVGPWEGALQNDGEAIRIEDALGNTVDEVRYGEGGDWGELADGKGSSLELIDPRQHNGAGSAWEASDERDQADWVQLSYTGAYTAQAESVFHFMPIDDGSFLLDDVEILKGAVNHVPNGGFEAASTSPWVMQGTLIRSRRTTAEAHSGSACLEVIATAGGDMRVNRLAVPTSPAMTSGTYTVRFWARWLHGGNLILAHGFDNALASTLWLPVPRDVGTPGRENGATARLRAQAGGVVNLGPVIGEVSHAPARPGQGQAVVVKAAISDADGVQSAAVRYRLGGLGDGVFTAVAMTAGGGGTWTASLPGFNLRDKVVFYIEAADARGASRRYPVNAPERTLLYQVGSALGGGLQTYRLAMDDDQQGYLESRQLHSDDPVYGSFVFEDSEVYYNVGLHYHGSPWNRPGSPRMYKLSFPGDRPFHGVRRFNISRYGSAQNEATAYYTVGRTGRPESPSPHGEYRFVRWEVSGQDQGVMSHVETVDRDYVARWFPADRDGLLLRANGKITFRLDENWGLSSWAAFAWRGTVKESYRWNWNLHTRVLEDEWAPLIALMKVMDPGQTPSTAAFDAAVKGILDVEEMARVLAVRVLNDDWDAIGVGNGQNAYLYYAPAEGRWKYLPWDMDHTYGNASATTSPTADPGVTRFLGRPEFRRIYLQTFQSMLRDTWNVPRLSLVLDPTEASGVGNSGGIKSFVAARTPAIQAALGAAPAFRIRTNNGNDLVVNTASTTIDGDAPLPVRTIVLGGEPVEGLVWTSTTVWRLTVPLDSGANPLEFVGVDADGNVVGSDSIVVTSTFQWSSPAIASVEPPSGPEAGGTRVAILGSDFHQGIRVLFGAGAAASVEYVSTGQVDAVTPAGSGSVEVKVTNVDGRSASLPGGFTFYGPELVRGDASGDGLTQINDAVRVLEYLFRGGAAGCLDAADANDDGAVDLSDALRILLFLFASGPALPPPHPAAGPDPTPDSLTC